MLTAMQAIAAMRMDGFKPALVELRLIGPKQFPFWSFTGDCLAEVVLPATPDVVRMDFRPLVGCVVMLFAEKRDETLRRLTERLTKIVSILAVFVLDDESHGFGYEWQAGKGWREIAGGVR